MANWEEVPQELLELIAQRLTIEDFVAFGMVCTSWRSAAVKETYNAKSKAPWLMTQSQTYVYSRRPDFFDPSRGRIYRWKLPCIEAETLSTLSTPGWIVVSNRRHECRIFNPLSRISIELPVLKKLRHMSPLSGPDRIALSSSPALSSSYIVMISFIMISVNGDLLMPGLAFLRSGEDAWTVMSTATPRNLVRGLIYYDGLFVALDVGGHITILNERKGRMESRQVLGRSFAGCPYLVECLGSLLVVWKMWSEGYGFRVFEVDLEKGTQEEVSCLGNASLFLSENTSSSFSVVFNAESCLLGIKPNHIYFTDYIDKKKKSYRMDNGRVGTCDDAAHHTYLYAAKWFQPGF